MKNKYLVIFLALTFGLCWGLAGVYFMFYDYLSSIFGEVSFSNPGVVFSMYSASIAGIVVYGLMGGFKAIKTLFSKFAVRKQDLIWFPISIVMAILFYVSMRFGSIAVGFDVPEMTLSPKQMFVEVLINLFQEVCIIGGVFGWVGFLMPFLQKKFNSNIKAGLLVGLVFGIYVLPGHAISSFELLASYPLYVIQMMLFYVFISYMFNATNGNLTLYVFLFWLIASGSRLQFYYFNPKVQILQIAFFALANIVIHFVFKKKNIEHKLQVLPEYAGIQS